MAHDRMVAGIRCFEVLDRLSEYIDGELDEVERGRIDAHLEGCDWCAQFGGDVSDTVREIRATLGAPAPMPQIVRERLERALQEELTQTR